jgi:hypothetical protein
LLALVVVTLLSRHQASSIKSIKNKKTNKKTKRKKEKKFEKVCQK